ncbi:MAG: 16S rRNA processing protein RimM [Bradymonadia bacterium]|jgi:16S rRNA processing protein RimM
MIEAIPWVRFGKLGRAHGLRGEVRFFPSNEGSGNVGRLKDVRLVLEDRVKILRVARVRGAVGKRVLTIEGWGRREDADPWVHASLEVPRNWLPESDEAGAFYGYQLEGLAVIDASGATVGKVIGLLDFGAGDLLEVRVRGKDVLLPFAEPHVGAIDLEAGTLVADLTDWLDT